MTNIRGQVQSQIFTYMLGMIVISITIFIGYKVIAGFADIGPKINDFKLDLEFIVGDVGNEFGSFKRDRIPLTSKIEAVCFANSNINDNDEDIPVVSPTDLDNFKEDLSNKAYGAILDSIETGVKSNVFIVTKKNIEDAFYIPKLSVGNSKTIICIPNRNGINFALEGKGNFANLFASCEDDGDCMSMSCDLSDKKICQ